MKATSEVYDGYDCVSSLTEESAKIQAAVLELESMKPFEMIKGLKEIVETMQSTFA